MREIDPMKSKRAQSWQLYIHAPMPMVTIFKTFDITNLMKLKNQGYKLNMLMCYCIMQAAAKMEEFYLLPVGEKMIQYDYIGVNVIVANAQGGINSCDLPYTNDLEEFNEIYKRRTHQVYESCQDYEIDQHMIVGTSALVKYDIDGAVNMYSGIFNNPFMIWGKYHKEDRKTTLQVSFQFHHVQMDGLQACEYENILQEFIHQS